MGDKVGSLNGETTQKACDIDDPLKEFILVQQPKSAGSDEPDGKSKVPVVQQKGRFKVTSEEPHVDKVVPSPVMSKSRSVQVFNQLQGVTATLSPPSTEVALTQQAGNSIFSVLLSMLRTNIAERDIILNMMKRNSGGDISENHDGRITPLPKNLTEKSMLDAVQDREKELLRQVTELQLRLFHTQEELDKFKLEHLQVKDL